MSVCEHVWVSMVCVCVCVCVRVWGEGAVEVYVRREQFLVRY